MLKEEHAEEEWRWESLHPSTREFETHLPFLVGSIEEIQQAIPIRKRQVLELLILKQCINPTELHFTISWDYIDDLIARTEAVEWIKTQDMHYSYEWLHEVIEPILLPIFEAAERTGIAPKWHSDRYRFTDWLPELTGSVKDVREGTAIRREKAAELLDLKGSIQLSDAFCRLAYAYIDNLINRTQAREWIESESMVYDEVWLDNSLKSLISNMLDEASEQVFERNYVLPYLSGLLIQGANLASDRAEELINRFLAYHPAGFLRNDDTVEDYIPAEIKLLQDDVLSNIDMVRQDILQNPHLQNVPNEKLSGQAI